MQWWWPIPMYNYSALACCRDYSADVRCLNLAWLIKGTLPYRNHSSFMTISVLGSPALHTKLSDQLPVMNDIVWVADFFTTIIQSIGTMNMEGCCYSSNPSVIEDVCHNYVLKAGMAPCISAVLSLTHQLIKTTAVIHEHIAGWLFDKARFYMLLVILRPHCNHMGTQLPLHAVKTKSTGPLDWDQKKTMHSFGEVYVHRYIIFSTSMEVYLLYWVRLTVCGQIWLFAKVRPYLIPWQAYMDVYDILQCKSTQCTME